MLAAASAPSHQDPDTLLPHPPELAAAVAFWSRVYSEVGTDGGFVHDARFLDVVYAVIRGADRPGRQTEHQQLEAVTERYRSLLRGLARGETPADPEAARVAELWRGHGADALTAAADRLRFQRGQANRFREGIVRSGAWRDYIRDTLREQGVPDALAALPHVESSFDPSARSHADAQGLWQFTSATGRRYMQIDHVIDERLDPYLSTKAAAQLLRHNYEVTGTWPLAITAYNHGAAGMRRAVEQLATRDMGVIARDYQGRSFGFASRNFYAAFLAARDVEARAAALFGPVPTTAPRSERVAAPPDYIGARTLAAAVGVDLDVLRRYNPALRPPVWNEEKRWPRGFPVRLPTGEGAEDLELALMTIPADQWHPGQVPDEYHRVGRGEALSSIAARYGTSVRALAGLNDLRDPHRIRAGTLLRLPAAADDSPKARPAVLRASEPALVAPAAPVSPVVERAIAAAADVGPEPVEGDVAGMPRELGADPSDFDIAADGSIEIQPFETLGHYADWLGVPAGHLRQLNGMRQAGALVVGRRLKLDLGRVDRTTFEARRRDYHRVLQDAFFAQYRITGTAEHRVQAGDSLWRLTHRYAQVPIWLMRQYNPDLDFGALRPGAAVLVPVVERTADAGLEQEAPAAECVC
jgi:membrane-bound lytic murein transglycosylase D